MTPELMREVSVRGWGALSDGKTSRIDYFRWAVAMPVNKDVIRFCALGLLADNPDERTTCILLIMVLCGEKFTDSFIEGQCLPVELERQVNILRKAGS